MNTIPDTTLQDVQEFVQRGINLNEGRISARNSAFWQSLKETGTELWLDTGDIDLAESVWTAEMTALTTNNTLLNMEIQKGIYDDYILEANKILDSLTVDQKVIEIGFILNARHGLTLAQRFGGKVSVELHTDFAHDMDGILFYAKRFHEICPDHFIIKVPYTATGLLGVRKLVKENVPINLTLGFSARQNALATSVSKPDYVNVFLGRLNAYVMDNNLGDGLLIGEKATLASQRIVKKISGTNIRATKQIAASMRSGDQVHSLAGVNVFTMPVKVVKEAYMNISQKFEDKTPMDYQIKLARDFDPEDIKAYHLWHVNDTELSLAEYLDKNPPESGKELETIARSMNCEDMFPVLNKGEIDQIGKDGKIPKHTKWMKHVRKGKIGIDTLLNLAGLASFTKDQKALDERIRKIIG